MKRKTVSSVNFGTRVKLTPQGKVYRVKGSDTAHGALTVGGKFGHCLVLQDTQGKEKRVSWGTDVYVLDQSYIGRYNTLGYSVVVMFANGHEDTLYTAGNSPLDSQWYVEDGLDLDTMKRYCEQTTKEMATENKGAFGGVEFYHSENAPS